MTTCEPPGGCIVPVLRYRDAEKAIDWLCEAFGFERQLVVPGAEGGIAHAQLRLGNGMIMLGSAAHGGPYADLVRAPGEGREAGERPTGGLYVVVSDVDAHLARARAAGAEILLEPSDKEYGGRDYTCRDPEGQIWTFGTYDPWV